MNSYLSCILSNLDSEFEFLQNKCILNEFFCHFFIRKNKKFTKTFTYDSFLINFANAKVGWMCIEYSGVSMMGGNCEKSIINIMFILVNGKTLDYNLYTFNCIVTSMLRPTIEYQQSWIQYWANSLLLSSIYLWLHVCH